MRARLAVASALAAMLATNSPALAAPPWSPPREIGVPGSDAARVGIDFGADGTALLSWTDLFLVAGQPSRPAQGHLAALLPDGNVEDRERPSGALRTPPQVFGGNRTVAVRERRRGLHSGSLRVTLDASFGTTVGPLLARTRRVAEFRASLPEINPPVLATSESGEVAVAWVEVDRGSARDSDFYRYRVKLAISHDGGRFSRPRTLARFTLPAHDSVPVAAVYGRRGELLVAYGAGRRVGRTIRPYLAARLRPRAGRRFGRPQRIGPRSDGDLAAAAAPNGRMALIWGSQRGGTEVESPRVVRSAIRAPGRRFSPAVVLDRGDRHETVPGRSTLAMAPDGSATALWGNARGSGPDLEFPVRTATAPPGAGFGRVTTLAATGVAGSVSAAPNSRMLLTWSSADYGSAIPGDEDADVFAALRPAGALAPGPPETVSTPEFEDLIPAAAFDPLSGRPTILWPAAQETATGQVGNLRLQVATRSG